MDIKNEKAVINDKELEAVTGGTLFIANPVANMSETEAEKIAAELGDGKDMGSWKTMSGDEFLKWLEETQRSMN